MGPATAAVGGVVRDAVRDAARESNQALSLALAATLLWGVLTVALSALLLQIDAITVTWARFAAAALLQMGWLAPRQGLSALALRAWPHRWALALMTLMLAGNYVLVASSLHHLPADASSLLSQLQSVLLLGVGVLLFSERLKPSQWLGVVVLLAGLALFFRHGWQAMATASGRAGLGVGLMLLSVVCWVAYAVLQRRVGRHLPSTQSLAWLYVAAALLLAPLAEPSRLLQLDPVGAALLLFCCANTVVAYGSFAAAMARAPTTLVSAIVATSPLVTIATLALLAHVLPASSLPRADLSPLNLLAVAMIVGGCVTCVVLRSPRSGSLS
jgi:drug/metabolite transporter (DMT)-like permease